MKTGDKIWMCLAGIALVALGVLCIAYPVATLLSLSWLIALLFFVGGCAQMGYWSKVRAFIPNSGLVFFSALLEIILGIMMICMPAPMVIALPFIFAFWILFEGIDMAIISIDIKRVGFPKWWILFCIALIVSAFGVCCLVYPNVGAETIAVLIGVAIIMNGIGYWVRVALVNKVENRFAQIKKNLADAFEQATKIPEGPAPEA